MPTAVTVTTAGSQVQVSAVLAAGSWSSPAVDATKLFALVVDPGGSFERTLYPRLSSPQAALAVSTTTNPNDTATVTFNLNGESPASPGSGGQQFTDAHDSETVEVGTGGIPAGLIYDADSSSDAVSAATSVTNNSTTLNPMPIAKWVTVPRRPITGDLELLVDAAHMYGIDEVEVTVSDGVNSIPKSAATRTTVTLGDGTIYPGQVADFYRVIFSSAELASASITDGIITCTFTVTANGGETHTTASTNAERPLTLRLDQAGTYSAGLRSYYVDNRHAMTTGALTGGTISKRDIIVGATSGAVGIVQADYAGSGTIYFVSPTPNVAFQSGETVNVQSFGDRTSTGVSFTTTSISAPLVANTAGAGTEADPVGNAYNAMRLESNASGGTASCYIYHLYDFFLWGHLATMFWTGQTENPTWTVITKAPGRTDDDVRYLGASGLSEPRVKGHDWFSVQDVMYAAWDESSPNGVFSGGDGGSRFKCWINNLRTAPPAGSYKSSAGSCFGLWWTHIDCADGVWLTPGSTKADDFTDAEALGTVVIDWRADATAAYASEDDWKIFSGANDGNALFLNVRLANLQGSGPGGHADTFQTIVSPSPNVIIHNFIDRNNRYQNFFLGGGTAGWAILNYLGEQTDDGDVGSAGVAVDFPVDHLIISHATVLAEAKSSSLNWQGSAYGTNVKVRNAVFTGMPSNTADSSGILPRRAVGFTNLHGRLSVEGVRGTTGGDEATIFAASSDNAGVHPSAATDAGYRAKAGGPLDGRLLPVDNIDGLLTDFLGNEIAWDGSGSIGAGTADPTAGTSRGFRSTRWRLRF